MEHGWGCPPRSSCDQKIFLGERDLCLNGWIHEVLAKMKDNITIVIRKIPPISLGSVPAETDLSTLILIVLRGGGIHTMLGLIDWAWSGARTFSRWRQMSKTEETMLHHAFLDHHVKYYRNNLRHHILILIL